MKKIENSDKEVRSYFKRQIKEFQNKCKKFLNQKMLK